MYMHKTSNISQKKNQINKCILTCTVHTCTHMHICINQSTTLHPYMYMYNVYPITFFCILWNIFLLHLQCTGTCTCTCMYIVQLTPPTSTPSSNLSKALLSSRNWLDCPRASWTLCFNISCSISSFSILSNWCSKLSFVAVNISHCVSSSCSFFLQLLNSLFWTAILS